MRVKINHTSSTPAVTLCNPVVPLSSLVACSKWLRFPDLSRCGGEGELTPLSTLFKSTFLSPLKISSYSGPCSDSSRCRPEDRGVKDVEHGTEECRDHGGQIKPHGRHGKVARLMIL